MRGLEKVEEVKMEETQGKKKHKVLKRVLIGLVILILLGLTAAYIAIGYYYQDKFYEGTIINGTDCSNQNVAYIKEIVKKVIFFTIDKSNKFLKDTKITGNQRFLELLISDSNKYKN